MVQRRTARQRAALRKAQLASARKRRRNRNIVIGAVGVAAGIGLGAAGAKYGKHIKIPKRTSHRSEFRINGMLALPAGKSAYRPKREIRRPKPIVRKGIFKVGVKGAPSYLKRHRPAYDAVRRTTYVSKPRPKKYKPRSA